MLGSHCLICQIRKGKISKTTHWVDEIMDPQHKSGMAVCAECATEKVAEAIQDPSITKVVVMCWEGK